MKYFTAIFFLTFTSYVYAWQTQTVRVNNMRYEKIFSPSSKDKNEVIFVPSNGLAFESNLAEAKCMQDFKIVDITEIGKPKELDKNRTSQEQEIAKRVAHCGKNIEAKDLSPCKTVLGEKDGQPTRTLSCSKKINDE